MAWLDTYLHANLLLVLVLLLSTVTVTWFRFTKPEHPLRSQQAWLMGYSHSNTHQSQSDAEDHKTTQTQSSRPFALPGVTLFHQSWVYAVTRLEGFMKIAP